MKRIAIVAVTLMLAGCGVSPENPPVKEQKPASQSHHAQERTQQQIWLTWLQMSLTNKECTRWEQPETWQDMMLPPKPNAHPNPNAC